MQDCYLFFDGIIQVSVKCMRKKQKAFYEK